jgi:PilZ domain
MDRGAAMMRYTFDSMGQLARHLHVVDNKALLFVRDQKSKATTGGRVMVELEVSELEQKTCVRGEVVARAEGQLPGAWLQFADTRLARRLHKGGFTIRRERRVSAEQLLQLNSPAGTQLIVQLLDMSEGGMRVRCAHGLSAGETCSIRLLGARTAHGDLGVASVLRADGQEVGLRFATRDNPAVKRYLQGLHEAWDRAVQIKHLPECCLQRGPIEPSLPKLHKKDML